MEIAQSAQIPAENTQPVNSYRFTFLPLVIAKTTKNIKREPQGSESPSLPKLNLLYIANISEINRIIVSLQLLTYYPASIDRKLFLRVLYLLSLLLTSYFLLNTLQ